MLEKLNEYRNEQKALIHAELFACLYNLLCAYFKNHGIHMENPYRGIYYVMDSVLFPTQIIVSRELDRKTHVWLRALSDKMGNQDMEELLKKIESMKQKLDRELAESVLEVSIRANQHVVEELRGDGRMCQALLEIMEPEISKIKESVKKETIDVILGNKI